MPGVGYLHFAYYDLGLMPAPPAGLDFRSALVAKLQSESAITAVVAVGNVVPGNIPQTAILPSLVVSVDEIERGYGLSEENGIATADVEFMTCSKLLSDCVTVAKAIRNAFSGYKGLMSGTVQVYGAFLQKESDPYLPNDNASDDGTRVVSVEVRFRYRETQPTLV